MEVPSDLSCPICGHSQDDVAYTTPCLPQLCYGCALWCARKKPRCATCGHKIRTIRYSVRSEDDYIESPVPQPTAHSGYSLQGKQEPAELILLPPEHSFPPEVWAAYFQEHPQDLRPLLSGSNKKSGGCPLMGGGKCKQGRAFFWAFCANTDLTRQTCSRSYS